VNYLDELFVWLISVVCMVVGRLDASCLNIRCGPSGAGIYYTTKSVSCCVLGVECLYVFR
jgi:hypothetical protein